MLSIGQRVKIKVDTPLFVDTEGIVKGYKQEPNITLYIVEIDTNHALDKLTRVINPQRRLYLEGALEVIDNV